MRITKQDLKHGIIRVQLENPDDLWDIQSVLEPGDEVRSSTERKIKLGSSDEKTRVIKKRVTLTIRVDKIDFAGEEVRVLGPIIDGPDDMPRGSAHSFSLTEGTEITIKKLEWAGYQRARLEEATKARRQVLIVLFDRERALYLAVSGRRVENLLELKGTVNKKGLDEQTKSTFYQDIVAHTQEYWTRLKPAGIVYASPAFWHEYVKKHLPAELKKHVVFTTISDIDRTAVHELVKRPELQNVLKDNRATMELGYVEEIHAALAHDKLAYGDKDVTEAISAGNIKGVYVTESRIRKAREQENFGALERAMKAAEKTGGAVHIISSDEACQKLDGLGGFVAIQRW